MSVYICPVCSALLFKEGGALKCSAGHSFDISKYGYVNLLMSSASRDKRHGDDKLMIRARRDFLDGGFYSPLKDAALDLVCARAFSGMKILDTGCGECYYTAAIAQELAEGGIEADINGIDISKDALIYASRRRQDLSLAVASVFRLPAADRSCDMLINFFAPLAPDEFLRVLPSGGFLLRAVPLENHLLGLKSAVYSKPYTNPAPDFRLSGYTLLEHRDIKYTLTLNSRQDISNLFMMTPYYYKTGKSDQEKLQNLDQLSTPVEFGLTLYCKD